MKKALSILLTVVIILTFAVFPASAEAVPTTITYLSDTGSNHHGSFVFANTVDGDDTTSWVSDQYKGTQGNGTIEIIYGLDTPGTLDTLVIKWGNNGNWGFQAPNAYNVYVSSDNENWGDPLFTYTDLYSKAVGDDGRFNVISTSDAYRKFNVTETGINVENAAYIKVVITNWKYRPAMYEISATTEAPKVPATYTVNYVDEKGNPIADAKSGEGFVGDAVTENAPAVLGYTADDQSKTVTLVDGVNVINFTYTKNNFPEEVGLTYYAKSGTSTAAGSFENTTDGNPDNCWASDQYKGTQGNGTIEIIYQLEAPGTLDAVTVSWGANNVWGQQAPNAYNVYASADGENWGTPIATHTDLYSLPSGSNGNILVINATDAYRKIIAMDTDFQDDSVVEYIKVEITNWKYRPTICEISAMAIIGGIEQPEIEDNLAIEGAQIRLPEGEIEAGLRFGATLQKSFLGIEGDYAYSGTATTTFGMFLLPEDMLAEGQTLAQYLETNGYAGDAVKVPAVKIYSQNADSVTYTAVLTDIPAEDYDRDIVAVPYVCTNGTYEFAGEETRNYKAVSESVGAAYEAGRLALTADQKALLEGVLGRALVAPEA